MDAGSALESGRGACQDAVGCAATLVRGDGGREEARFAYVVGCDGHAGITRTFTRLDFQPRRTGVAIFDRWRPDAPQAFSAVAALALTPSGPELLRSAA